MWIEKKQTNITLSFIANKTTVATITAISNDAAKFPSSYLLRLTRKMNEMRLL
jgi:hypothetical protein